MIKLQRANELREKEQYITNLSKKNNKRKVRFNINKTSTPTKKLRTSPRTRGTSTCTDNATESTDILSPKELEMTTIDVRSDPVISSDTDLSQEEICPMAPDDLQLYDSPNPIILPNSDCSSTSPLYGNPIIKSVLPDTTNTITRPIESYLWLKDTLHRDFDDQLVYKTVSIYPYRFEKDYYIVGDRELRLPNNTFIPVKHGKCIHIRELERYTLAYQSHKNKVHMVTTSVHSFDTVVTTNSINELVFLLSDTSTFAKKIPKTHYMAMKSSDRDHWLVAEKAEIDSLNEHNVFVPSILPSDKSAVDTKWVYVIKYKNGIINKYKARLVAKGFTQIYGIDYDETYAPVARMTSLRLVLSISAMLSLEVHQMDVETAFLNADLQEDVYIKPPEGIDLPSGYNCFKLTKALYGLKQSPREWYNNINTFLQSLGFIRLQSEHCLYFYNHDSQICIISLYVDDLIIASSHMSLTERVKSGLSTKYKMKDLGHIDEILGCKVRVNLIQGHITICQKKYLQTTLQKFLPENATPISTPCDPTIILSTNHCPTTAADIKFMEQIPYRSAVGSLLWLSLGSRPDIAYAVSQVAKFSSNPGRIHWDAIIRILRYLKGTTHLGLQYKCNTGRTPTRIITDISTTISEPLPKSTSTITDVLPEAFSDADYARDTDTRRSVTGFIFFLGGAPISWQSRHQPSVALSTMEAEFMAACAAAQEAVWLRQLLKEFTCSIFNPIIIFEDNKACIDYTKNSTNHPRTKHIDTKYHFIRDLVQQDIIKLEPVKSADNIADIFTKPLATQSFLYLRNKFMTLISDYDSLGNVIPHEDIGILNDT